MTTESHEQTQQRLGALVQSAISGLPISAMVDYSPLFGTLTLDLWSNGSFPQRRSWSISPEGSEHFERYLKDRIAEFLRETDPQDSVA